MSDPRFAEGSDSGPPVLTLSGVTKTFSSVQETLRVLDGVDWVLEKGVSAAITGESGAGKSTLLHLAAALDRPSGGRVLVDGTDLGPLKEKNLAEFRAHKVGIIFQFHFLLKEFSVGENVWMPAWLAGTSKNESKERARGLLTAVGLENRWGDFPGVLSGGERQRVALARALVNDPSLLLADEPTGNLDERNAGVVRRLLLDLVKERGKTLLLVTHDRSFAEECDQIWRLSGGRLSREGS